MLCYAAARCDDMIFLKISHIYNNNSIILSYMMHRIATMMFSGAIPRARPYQQSPAHKHGGKVSK